MDAQALAHISEIDIRTRKEHINKLVDDVDDLRRTE